MTLNATKGSIFILLCVLLFQYHGANAESNLVRSNCSTLEGYVDYREKGFKNESLMYAECIRKEYPLIGDFHESDFNSVSLLSGKKIFISPRMEEERIELAWFAKICLNRIFYDMICQRNESLLKPPFQTDGRCPLPSVFEPSENDLQSWAWGRLAGRRNTCTALSSRMVTNKIEISGGALESMITGGGLFTLSDLSIKSMSMKRLDLNNALLIGNLEITDSAIDRISFGNLIVLGDLIIIGNILDSIKMDGIWVRGSLVYEGNMQKSAKIFSAKLGNSLKWINNITQYSRFDSFGAELVEIEGKLVTSGNTAEADNEKVMGRILKFMEQLKQMKEKQREKQKASSF